MRLNQYEKSIYVLKENVPNFIRLAYSTFADLFNVLFEDCICEAAKEIPSSTRDVCNALLCCYGSRGVSFSDICFKYFTQINNIREFNEKLAKLCVHGKEEFSTSKEDIFFNVNDTDIEAPVESIRGVFSLANEVVNGWSCSSSKTEVCEKIVPLIFQPVFNTYNHNNRADIKDLTGTDSILSHGTTELCVDLGALFDSFFEKAIDLSKFGEEEAVVSNESEVVSREIEEKLETILDRLSSVGKVIQNKASDICEGITKTLLASALATYTVYASKLIGSKQDIYDWAYKAFVKDSLSFIDVKDYINNADITRYSGHRTGEKEDIGKPYGMSASESTDTDGNINTTLNSGALNFNNGDLPITVKKIIYRSIRLQYSLWASVINSIFCTGKSNKTKLNYASVTYVTDDPVLGNRYDSLLDLSRAIFSSFAKARYRTFNTGTQFTEKREAVSSLSSVDIGISKIVDQKAKEILKESTKNFKIGSLFFNDLNNSVILTEANNRAINEIRKLFIQTAYLLMLNKINQNSGKILEDEDPITGKTRKELFNEIYYGISINLSKAINAISDNFDTAYEVFKTLKDTGLSAFVSAVSPADDIYGKLGAHIEHKDRFGRMNRKVCDIVCYSKGGEKPSLREMFGADELSDTKEILKWFILDRVLVPYYSDFLDIKSVSYKYQFVDRIPDEQPFTDFTAANKTGSLFPKNRVVVDQLNMISKMQAEKNKYFTIESINSAMDDLEISMCASDAMANNGSYNALASIGSSISSLEISTDNVDDAGHSPVDESDTRLNASENPLEGTVTNTDANGTELGPNPTDAEDQRKFTVHDSMESAHAAQMKELNQRFIEQTIERYNELFNKVIFNVEKK